MSSVLPAQYYNRKRLTIALDKEDIQSISKSMNIATIYGIVSICFVLTGICIDSAVFVDWLAVFIVVAEVNIFVALALSFNLFFLLLDAHASLALLDELHHLADDKDLSIEQFCDTRKNIHHRVKSSRLACDFIIIPCVASLAGILMSVLLINHSYSGTSNDDDDYLRTAGFVFVGTIVLLFKELLYLMVAFWYVARVIARADELTVKLSEEFWGDYSEHTDTQVSVRSITNPASPVHLCDLHRLSIHATSMSRPVTFTLLFKRVTWTTVALSALGVVTTLNVGVVNSTLFYK